MAQERQERRYEVGLNTSEVFTVIVRARSKAEAERKARAGDYEESWASLDRKITGVRYVEEQD